MDDVEKIVICEECDGFDIFILHSSGSHTKFSFNQEDSKQDLVKVFQFLGYKSEYEEVY